MPLDQLLALYGYAPPTSTAPMSVAEPKGEEEEEKDVPPPRQSGSSVRSRRRNRVVPLEAQKEVTPDAADTSQDETVVAMGAGSSFISSSDALLPPEGRVMATVLKTSPPLPSTSMSGGMIAALLRKPSPFKKSTGDEQSETRPSRSLPEIHSNTRSQSELGVIRDAEGEDIEGEEEVDVEEMGEVDFGMVRGGDEEELRLDHLMDVVHMGDIEAGLSRNGGEILEEVGVSEGEVLSGDGETLEPQQDYREELEQEEEDGRRGVAEDLQRSLRKRKKTAVYEDVMLSSGLSDAIGRLSLRNHPPILKWCMNYIHSE